MIRVRISRILVQCSNVCVGYFTLRSSGDSKENLRQPFGASNSTCVSSCLDLQQCAISRLSLDSRRPAQAGFCSLWLCPRLSSDVQPDLQVPTLDWYKIFTVHPQPHKIQSTLESTSLQLATGGDRTTNNRTIHFLNTCTPRKPTQAL